MSITGAEGDDRRLPSIASCSTFDSPSGSAGRDVIRRGCTVELRFLPTACPELNPVEGLWRHAKGRVLANEPTPDLDDSLGRVCEELFEMSGRERLRLAGVLSGNFWLPT